MVEKTVERFIASIRNTKWLDNHGEIDPSWKLFPTRAEAVAAVTKTISKDVAAKDAAWEAAWNATKNAAKGAAWAATWAAVKAAAKDGAWDGAWEAAWDTAWAAARDAAWEAAWAAVKAGARGAAWDAAWAAAIMAQMEICCDLPVPQEYRQHAKDRWAVWQAGYGCLCDVNGVLYCYRRV